MTESGIKIDSISCRPLNAFASILVADAEISEDEDSDTFSSTFLFLFSIALY
jgi:hypothetical protein